MYEPFNIETANEEDRAAWTLCQIIDDDAPLRWTRYRGVAACIAKNKDLMRCLEALGPGNHTENNVSNSEQNREMD